METTFESKAALATWADDHTMAELVALYNGLPGVTATKRFTDRPTGVTRIWAALHPEAKVAAPKKTSTRKTIPQTVPPMAYQLEKAYQGILSGEISPAEARKVLRENKKEIESALQKEAMMALVAMKEGRAPRKKKATKTTGTKAPAAKPARAPKLSKTRKGKEGATKAKGDGTTVRERAIEMLKAGTTLEALMKAFGWQAHTTRGFVSIVGKEHKIESTKVDGVRHYKIR